MADSHHIIDGKVVPYSGGRKCNDTDAWRDATPLELQLQEQLEEYEHTTAAQEAEIEALRAEVEKLRALAGCAYQMAGMHDAPLVWLDRLSEAANGDALPDVDTLMDELLPYQPDAVCEAEAHADKLRAKVERLTFEMERLQQQYDERTACMIVHRGSALACSDAVRAAYSDEHERAERLAKERREFAKPEMAIGLYTEARND